MSPETERAIDEIKEHIDLILKPIQDDINEHKIILRGKNERNGLVGDVRDMKNIAKAVTVLGGGGGLVGIWAGLMAMFP